MDDRTQAPRQRPHQRSRAPARYERDLYSWAVEQAALLRAGRVTQADVHNIAEELDDVGNEQYDKMESALRLILLHLLKWDRQPQRRSRSWRTSILVQRKQVQKVLKKNPGLKPRLGEALADAYDTARLQAAAQTRLDDDTFPKRCPYSWHDIMERPVDWPPTH